MTYTFNCPNCGGENTYTGDEKSARCTFCGSEVPVPDDIVNEATVKKLSSRAVTWIIIFVIIVFVIPTCIGFGGAIIGFIATIFSAIVGVLASFVGH